MNKLKIFFVMGIVAFMLILCAFAPGICIDRFVLPDGCCTCCIESSSSCCNGCVSDDGRNCKCR